MKGETGNEGGRVKYKEQKGEKPQDLDLEIKVRVLLLEHVRIGEKTTKINYDEHLLV